MCGVIYKMTLFILLNLYPYKLSYGYLLPYAMTMYYKFLKQIIQTLEQMLESLYSYMPLLFEPDKHKCSNCLGQLFACFMFHCFYIRGTPQNLSSLPITIYIIVVNFVMML